MGVWGCFHRLMQALSDEQHFERIEMRMDRFEARMDGLEARMDRLESKMDDGFATVRSEFKSEIGSARSESRADFRALLGVQLTTIVALVLGFAGIALQHVGGAPGQMVDPTPRRDEVA